jgi:uncharacterized protein (TIGR02246 family)
MSDGLQDAVEQFLERLRAAWDAGDAASYAALFAEDATYVIFLGEVLIGRTAIERNHVDVFERWQKGTRMAVKAIAIRPMGPEACCLLTIGGIGEHNPIPYDKFQTFAVVHQGDRWLCAAFQNTSMSEHARRAHNEQPSANGG